MPTLSPTARKFVLHWGEMGSAWGINRSVAQVHALLYASPGPLSAEEIAETLSMARSNVSTSLRELQGWGVVRTVHKLGDRRDHFESLTDVWEMFKIVMAERRRREIEPTMRTLRECVAELDAKDPGDRALRGRLVAMLEFLESADACYQQLSRVPPAAMSKLLSLARKFAKPEKSRD